MHIKRVPPSEHAEPQFRLAFPTSRTSAFEPCIPTRGTKVPDRPKWLREVKMDGYRLIIQRDGKRVRLFTRNGHDWSDRYPLITEAALRIHPVHLVRPGR